ncbi:hypothetical protein UO65_3749 [Actinokineospora spheciospongiae]|uniref:Uncharacterized protein n=1 Tax=Actinokineospora spheciospongiae TaxID=909613 RepID=W7IJD5_9PSEU|nr:hypothetical protein UO65_3749 [Actinokineospora spheciospongiae]
MFTKAEGAATVKPEALKTAAEQQKPSNTNGTPARTGR